jgi:hypothetical protein
MQNNVWEWIQSHGTLVLLGVVAIVVGIMFLKKQPPTAVSGVSPADLSGLTTDANGNPIVYRAVSDTFVTENISGSYNSATAADNAPASIGATTVNSTSTTDNHSSPIEHPIEPAPAPAPHLSNGLLGPSIEVDFTHRTYKSATIKTPTPIPIPASDPLVAGNQGRVWFIDNGVQRLLTSGYGGPVSNDGVPAGSSSSSSGSTTQTNSSYSSTVNTTH